MLDMSGVALCSLVLQPPGKAARRNLQPETYTIERLSTNPWVRIFVNGYLLTPPGLAEEDCRVLMPVEVGDIVNIDGIQYHVCSKIPDCLAMRPATNDADISPAGINQWKSLSEDHFQSFKKTSLLQFVPSVGLPQQFRFGSRVKNLILTKFPKFRLIDIQPQLTLAIFRNSEGDLHINAVCVFQRITAIILSYHRITSLQGCSSVKPEWSVKSKYGVNCMVKEMLLLRMSCWQFDAPTWSPTGIGPKYTHRVRRFPSKGRKYFGETTVHIWLSDVHGSKPGATHELLGSAIEPDLRGVVITSQHPEGGFVAKLIASGEEIHANVWTLRPLTIVATPLVTASSFPFSKPFRVCINPSDAITQLKIGIEPGKHPTPSYVVMLENYQPNLAFTGQGSVLCKGDIIVGVAGFVFRTPTIHDPHSGERNLDMLKRVFTTRVLHESTSPSLVELMVLRPSGCTDWKKSLDQAISHHNGFVACERQRLELERFLEVGQGKLRGHYLVESILNHRNDDDDTNTEFLIKWKGWNNPSNFTWEVS